MTPLDRPLRRAILINGEPYVVTIDQDGLRLVRKGHRKGIEVSWQDVLSGSVTLGAQLVGSLPAASQKSPGKSRPKSSA